MENTKLRSQQHKFIYLKDGRCVRFNNFKKSFSSSEALLLDEIRGLHSCSIYCLDVGDGVLLFFPADEVRGLLILPRPENT